MIGAVLGSYEVVGELGSGGMGRVYLARDGEARVAVKVLHAHLLSTPGFFKRFLREAELGRAVDHPNVVRTLDADALTVNGETAHFLVMEYVEGQTLRALMDDVGPVGEELCRHIGREVAAGLAAIHGAGAVHRDLKPANVLITAANEVKLMDLGVARLADEALRLSRTGAFVGSVPYAAPEQFSRRRARVDHRADLFALGALLYELATGVHPFPGDDVMTVMRGVVEDDPEPAGRQNPRISPFFEEVVRTLLEKKPEKRFADAAAVAAVLSEGERSAWWTERARRIRARTRRSLPRVRVPRETALYGRDEELARLEALFAGVTAGAGRVLLIEGEAGVGKSRLVDEFVARLGTEGREPVFLYGSYPPGGAATAAGAWSRAFREHFGEEGLEESVGELLPGAPTLVAAFAALLRSAPPPGDVAPLSRDSLMTCFVSVTQALAAERPVVLLIDDLHFAPDEGRALFAALALAVADHPVLLAGTFRPGVPEAWLAAVERLEHAERMNLRRLGAKDLVRLLNEAFRSPRLAEDLSARIALKSDGNPFFVFEIVRGLREGGYIEEGQDGAWTARREVKDLDIPSSVLDLVRARVAELSEEERDLLEVASCIGFEFEPGLAADVAGVARIPALRQLGRIERRHRLVRSVGPRYVFDHHQVHEALYRGMAEPLRREFHAAIATTLVRREEDAGRGPERIDGPLAVELVEHHVESGRAAGAVPWLERAFVHLQGTNRLHRGLALAREVLSAGAPADATERADLLVRAAGFAEWTGDTDAARLYLEEAVRLAEEAGDRRRETSARDRLGLVRKGQGDLEAAHAELTRAMADADADPGADGRLRASTRMSLGGVLHRMGRPAEAKRLYEEALEIARARRNQLEAAKALGNLGLLAWESGDLERARSHLEKALATFRKAGDRRAEANAVGALGLVFDELGRFAEAAEQHARHLEIARDIGYRRGQAIAMSNLGDSLRMQGREEEALPPFEESARISREIGDPTGELSAMLNAGIALGHLGEFASARSAMLQAIRRARRLGAARDRALGFYQLAALHLGRGDLGRAERFARKSTVLMEELAYLPGLARVSLLLGVTLLERERSSAAREPLDRSREIAARLDNVPLVAAAMCHLARVGGADPREAARRFEEAAERLAPEDQIAAARSLWLATGELRLRRAFLTRTHRLLAGCSSERRGKILDAQYMIRELLSSEPDGSAAATGDLARLGPTQEE